MSEQVERLEQYKLFVEMTDRAASRRGLFAGSFLTINTVLAGLIGTFGEVKRPSTVLLTISLIVLLTFCGVWVLGLRSYRALLKAKWVVVSEMENELSFQPFTDEWRLVKGVNSGRPLERGNYLSLVLIEIALPVLFALNYVAVFIYLVS